MIKKTTVGLCQLAQPVGTELLILASPSRIPMMINGPGTCQIAFTTREAISEIQAFRHLSRHTKLSVLNIRIFNQRNGLLTSQGGGARSPGGRWCLEREPCVGARWRGGRAGTSRGGRPHPRGPVQVRARAAFRSFPSPLSHTNYTIFSNKRASPIRAAAYCRTSSPVALFRPPSLQGPESVLQRVDAK